MIVDFHAHTYESDGSLSPAELCNAMHKRGVTVFSITDHDTLAAYDGLTVAIPAPVWAAVRTWTPGEFARWLQRLAARADWRRYRKTKRGPKKPVVPVRAARNASHRSTARLIEAYRKTPAVPPPP